MSVIIFTTTAIAIDSSRTSTHGSHERGGEGRGGGGEIWKKKGGEGGGVMGLICCMGG